MSDPNSETITQKIQDAIDTLIEHCDAVVILASTMDPETHLVNLYHNYGGSYHTVLGMMEHYRASRLADKITTDLNQEDEE